MAYKYERLVGLCFQCGKVGHEVARCPHPFDGTIGSSLYGDWLQAGTKSRSSGSPGRMNSPPRRTPTPPPHAQEMGTPPLTGVVVDPTTDICGADKTGYASVILQP